MPFVFIARHQLTVSTAQKRSLGQDNVFTGVCLSTGGGGGCLLLGLWGVCLWVPGGEGVHTPLGHTPPLDTHTPTINKRAVHILLECFLVLFCFVFDREGGQRLRACLQIPSPRTCRSKSPSKFNIVPMVTDRLTDSACQCKFDSGRDGDGDRDGICKRTLTVLTDV